VALVEGDWAAAERGRERGRERRRVTRRRVRGGMGTL
jgi:hypothetical protein